MQLHRDLWSHAKYKKKLMCKFQNNFCKDRGMERRKDGKMDGMNKL